MTRCSEGSCSADVVVQAPGNLQSYNRYSYVMNNPLTLTDPSGFVWYNPLTWDIFGKRVGGTFISPVLPTETKKVDLFAGKDNWRQFFKYIPESPGGFARIVTTDEYRQAQGGPRVENSAVKPTITADTVTLQDSRGHSLLTKAIGADLGLIGMDPMKGPKSSPLLSSGDLKKASTEVTQKASEVSQRLERGRDGETRMVGVKSPDVRETVGQISIADAGAQANGRAFGAGLGLVAGAQEGMKEAAAMTEVTVRLVYSGGGLFGLGRQPTGQIIVEQVCDMNRVQNFAEDHGLPPLNITDRTVTVGENK